MKKAELVFVPSPRLSHLIPAVAVAKLLLYCDDHLSITMLIMKFPKDTTIHSYVQKISTNPNTSPRLCFINLPCQDEIPASKTIRYDFVGNQITHMRESLSCLIKQPSEAASQLAGLALNIFCTKFVEVAEELSIPAYVFLTSGACALSLLEHLFLLKFEQNQELTQYNNSDVEMSVPGFSIPVPAKVFPGFMVEEVPLSNDGNIFLNYIKRILGASGVLVNTFYELESFAIETLLSGGRTPKIYPVGPILNLIGGGDQSEQLFDDDVKKWLEGRSARKLSGFLVLWNYDEAQVKEIALALENSGNRFLWSLRKPGMKGTRTVTEYENFEEVLPEGFLEGTKGIGKVIGWAAQVAVLSHPAVGGFVSHCGWNSVLESVWFGAPIATFPLYTEQQLNAFQLVKGRGMAEMIRMNHKIDLMGERQPEIVGAEEIEAVIRRLMAAEGGSRVRQRVKEMHNRARSALLEGGSSYNALCLFIEDVIRNIA